METYRQLESGTSIATKVPRCRYWRHLSQPAGLTLARSVFSGNMFVCVGESLGLGSCRAPPKASSGDWALPNIALA